MKKTEKCKCFELSVQFIYECYFKYFSFLLTFAKWILRTTFLVQMYSRLVRFFSLNLFWFSTTNAILYACITRYISLYFNGLNFKSDFYKWHPYTLYIFKSIFRHCFWRNFFCPRLFYYKFSKYILAMKLKYLILQPVQKYIDR